MHSEKPTPKHRLRAAGVAVVCWIVIAILLFSPVSFRGVVADWAMGFVAALVGTVLAHEAAPRGFRWAVLYPAMVIGPSLAACTSAFGGPEREADLGTGCRANLVYDGWVASSWISVDVIETLPWTPLEIVRAQGRIVDLDALGAFNLDSVSVGRLPTPNCQPTFDYDGRRLRTSWVVR